MAKFEEGNSGKPKGAVNKVSKTVKDAVLEVFNRLQEDEESPAHLMNWAKKSPKDFYNIAAKLIPTEVNARITDINIPVAEWAKKNDKAE